jgi:hypothetical protein
VRYDSLRNDDVATQCPARVLIRDMNVDEKDAL